MKIAIVGGSPTSEFLAPFDDEDWEIWVLGNRLDRYINGRFHRVYEIHDNLSEHDDPQKYAQWLVQNTAAYGAKLIVGEKFPFADAHVTRFDYGASERLFGSSYLTSSPAYMMSDAIITGAEEIGIYGVDLSVDDHEYFWQRPCMEAWIGFAKGRGIKVTIPDVSHIGKCEYAEGRDWNGVREAQGVFTEDAFGEMARVHIQKIDALSAEKNGIDIKIAAHHGAQQVYERLAKVARASDAGIGMKSLLETFVTK